jgi:ABC-2 type transport system permease protein
MIAILKRETKAFFLNPIGYVYMGIFFFLSGLFFSFSIMNPMQVANYSDVLGTMAFTLLFVTPVLTMRLFSEERKTGTEQLLLTSPVSLTKVIAGKYLGALVPFLFTLIVTFAYPLILSRFSTIELSTICIGYLGYFLLGSAFIAVGLFVSSLTENQTVAAVVSFCFLLLLWVFEFIKQILPLSEKGQKTFDWFLLLNRYEDFGNGLLNISSVIYFLSVIFIFLFFTYRTIEKRRWSRG